MVDPDIPVIGSSFHGSTGQANFFQVYIIAVTNNTVDCSIIEYQFTILSKVKLINLPTD